MKSQLTDISDGQDLAYAAIKLVAIDLKKRKKYMIPQEMRAKLPSVSDIPGRYKPAQRPAKVFTYEYFVRPSDTDFNRHMNHCCYLEICLNAASVAQSSDVYNFKADPAEYDIKTIKMLYVGESHLGDVLVCHTWQDESNDLILHFEINSGLKTIHHSSFEYCSPLKNSKL